MQEKCIRGKEYKIKEMKGGEYIEKRMKRKDDERRKKGKEYFRCITERYGFKGETNRQGMLFMF